MKEEAEGVGGREEARIDTLRMFVKPIGNHIILFT